MNKTKRFEFRLYQKHIIALYKEIQKQQERGFFDEQALPSYTNPNFLMRYLFWQRIRVVMEHLNKKERFGTSLDFGCGLGTMIPFLLEKSDVVMAVDLAIEHLMLVAQEQGWERVTFAKELTPLMEEYENKVDVIVALDVLEHVADLDATIRSFKKLLAAGGEIVVCGPTENFFYRIGRKLAGYSGEYHNRNVYDILDAFRKEFEVEVIGRLFPVIPFFLIAKATPKRT